MTTENKLEESEVTKRKVAYKIRSFPGTYYYGAVQGEAPTINSLSSPAGSGEGGGDGGGA
jgi:hypothetical protein